MYNQQACLSSLFARTHADNAQIDRQARFWATDASLFLCMLLQLLGPVHILIALAVKFAAFSMHVSDVHNLSKLTLLEHDSSATFADYDQSDGLLS